MKKTHFDTTGIKITSRYIPYDTKLRIFGKDDYTCVYCQKELTFETATIEHILQMYRGGKNNEENLTTACSKCNLGRGGYTHDQWKAIKLKRAFATAVKVEELKKELKILEKAGRKTITISHVKFYLPK